MTVPARIIHLRFLNRAQAESLWPDADGLVNAVGAELRAHGWMMAVDPQLPFRMNRPAAGDRARRHRMGTMPPLPEAYDQ